MTKRKLTKHEDDIRRGLRPIDRYEPRARSIGGAWRMVKCIDGAYVDAEQHDEVVEYLRKNADISPPQSPYDGIHTCSKGCKKPGCNRTLRDTIEEQDQQIEALKRDVLEKTAELRKSEEHNEALCERMQDLNGEVFAASNINAKLHMNRVHDLNKMGGQCEEIARLKAEVERLTAFTTRTIIPNEELQAQVERLTKAGDAMAEAIDEHRHGKGGAWGIGFLVRENWKTAKWGKQP